MSTDEVHRHIRLTKLRTLFLFLPRSFTQRVGSVEANRAMRFSRDSIEQASLAGTRACWALCPDDGRRLGKTRQRISVVAARLNEDHPDCQKAHDPARARLCERDAPPRVRLRQDGRAGSFRGTREESDSRILAAARIAGLGKPK